MTKQNEELSKPGRRAALGLVLALSLALAPALGPGLGSQILLSGQCSFRIPAGFLPDFTQDKFEPFQATLLRTHMEN